MFFSEKRFVEIQLINQKKDWVTNVKDWQAVHLLRRVEDRPCCCEYTSTAPRSKLVTFSWSKHEWFLKIF